MKRGWRFSLELDRRSGEGQTPIFLQIARAIVDDVRRGRLKSGDELPGSRTLAETLSVHRNTVLAAYRELAAEGWVTFTPARGTFVTTDLPEPARAKKTLVRTSTPGLGFDLPAPPTDFAPAPPPPGVLSLHGGVPDVRFAPLAPLARAFRRALRHQGRGLLGYGDPRGPERLRTALAQ
ncbi:MAG TPA: GntR family transcriptional regulator, partial [Polyangiaceae bacterium]